MIEDHLPWEYIPKEKTLEEYLMAGGIIWCDNVDETYLSLKLIERETGIQMDEYCRDILNHADGTYSFLHPGVWILDEDTVENEDEQVGDPIIVCYASKTDCAHGISFDLCLELFDNQETMNEKDVSDIVSALYDGGEGLW